MSDNNVSKYVIDAAEDAFFAKLAELLPGIKTGDLDPIDDARFQVACRAVAEAWYAQNVRTPEPVHYAKGTAMAAFTVLMRPPKKGERGYWVSARTPSAALEEILRESEELGWISPKDQSAEPDEHGMIAVTIEIRAAKAPKAVSWEFRGRVHDFVATLPEYRGWKAAWEHPGYLAFNCEGTDITVCATPDHETIGFISIDVLDEDGDHEDGEGDELVWPVEGRTTESFMALVSPTLDRLMPRTRVRITLEITGPSVSAERAVEIALDSGVLQDAINEYESDAGTVTVVSAVQS